MKLFFDRTVTGDKKWIVYDNLQRKRTWRESNKSGQAMANPGLHPKKILLSDGIARVYRVSAIKIRIK